MLRPNTISSNNVALSFLKNNFLDQVIRGMQTQPENIFKS